MHLSMVSPRVGEGGGATHGKLTQRAFPWAGILTQNWEFDMPATLEDLENLEMTYIIFAIVGFLKLQSWTLINVKYLGAAIDTNVRI